MLRARQLQAKGCQGLMANSRSQEEAKKVLLKVLDMTLLTPSFQTSRVWSFERMHFFSFQLPCLWSFVLAALRNKHNMDISFEKKNRGREEERTKISEKRNRVILQRIEKKNSSIGGIYQIFSRKMKCGKEGK